MLFCCTSRELLVALPTFARLSSIMDRTASNGFLVSIGSSRGFPQIGPTRTSDLDLDQCISAVVTTLPNSSFRRRTTSRFTSNAKPEHLDTAAAGFGWG